MPLKLSLIHIYPDDKFFGQLSNGHVTQSTWKDGNYIANYSRFGMLLNGEGHQTIQSLYAIASGLSLIHIFGCGKCETRCPYNLPIRDMLKKVAQDFGE